MATIRCDVFEAAFESVRREIGRVVAELRSAISALDALAAQQTARPAAKAKAPKRAATKAPTPKREPAVKAAPPTKVRVTRGAVRGFIAESKGATTEDVSKRFGISEAGAYFHLNRMRKDGEATLGGDKKWRRVAAASQPAVN